MKVGEGVIPMHSTWRHQRKVRKISRITNEDMRKLDEYRGRIFQLKEEHEALAIFMVFSVIWIRRYGVIMGSMLMYRFMNCTKSG